MNRRNFFGIIFGGWLIGASGLKLSPPAPTKYIPVQRGSMWDQAVPITEVEEHLFLALKKATEETMDKFYMEHAQV